MSALHIAGLAAFLSLAAASPVSQSSQSTNTLSYLFIFGDSYTTTGFNASLLPQPSPQHPLGNPAYPGATLSGGENWVDIVAYNSSSHATTTGTGVVTYNYAVGSNTVNVSRTQIDPASAPSPIADMIEQVAEFKALVKNTGPYPAPSWTAKNSLFISWFGINDIFYNGIFTNRTFSEAMPYLRGDIGDFYGQLDLLYKLGARNFLTILIPPVNRTPVLVGSPNPKAVNLTQFWNNLIQQQNTGFLNSHAGAASRFYDPTPLFDNILDNYANYGAPNNTCFSYPAGTPCLWHDFIHPGLVIQQKLGESIAQDIKDGGFSW